MAIPGTRLFLNEVYNVIGKGRRYGSSKLITISGLFREELQQWLFLESWSGCLPRRQEAHCQVKLCTDASSLAWGCVFGPDTIAAAIRDFRPVDQHHLHINVKEALALANALDAFSSSFCDSWVDVYTDSQVLIASWRRQGSKSRDHADVFKRIFGIVSTYNIHLNLFYISSADNPADTPSRVFPLKDSKLSLSALVQVQAEFGGRSRQSTDLMALPSNLQCALDGSPLPFFSPYPLPGSSGVNLFAQRPDNHGCLFSKPYVFPPLFLSHRFCALSKLTVLLALLLFLMSGLVNFCGLFFNRIRLSCWPPGFSGHRSLYALPGQKNLFDATPLDICRFPVFKDSKGKTQVHKTGCPHLGQRGIFSCQCPLRLAYSTVDSYIGKLRSIFSDIGRQGDWNRTLFFGNPAFDLLAKQYLKEVTADHPQASCSSFS